MLAREAGLLKLGTVALDGTKVHANASRHSALSYEHASKLEAQLKAEVGELMALAEAADFADVPDGMSVLEELARREERLARIAAAKAKIEARAKERFAREQAEHEAKMRARAAKAKTTGRKPGGRPPQPPTAGPGPKDQVNLTDEDLRIMPGPGGGFEQAYNAQAAVATGSLLVVATDVVQAANDKEQIAPTLAALAALAEGLGKPEALLADSGYFSNANVMACAKAGIAPLIALGRERHNLAWQDRLAEAPPAPDSPTPLEAMAHRLASPEGRQLYALRKQTPEPGGIIKSIIGFKQGAKEREKKEGRGGEKKEKKRRNERLVRRGRLQDAEKPEAEDEELDRHRRQENAEDDLRDDERGGVHPLGDLVDVAEDGAVECAHQQDQADHQRGRGDRCRRLRRR